MTRALSPLILSSFLLAIACGPAGPSDSSSIEEETEEAWSRNWRRRFEMLDVLVVVDTSSVSEEERRAVGALVADHIQSIVTPQAPMTVDSLLAVPIEDVRVGIVLADPEVDEPLLQGLAGDFSVESRDSSCRSGPCPWLAHLNRLSANGCDVVPATLGEDVARLIAGLPASEGPAQPLGAALRVLADDAELSDPSERFIREDAQVAIVIASRDGDCTAPDGLYDPAAEELGPLNSRCERYADRLTSISTIKNELEALKEALGVRGISLGSTTSIPEDGSWRPGDSLAALDVTGGVRRLVEFTYTFFGYHGVVLPWLGDDYSLLLGLPGQILPGIEYIARCTMATLEEEGGCRFVETLPDDGPCPHDITQTVGRPCWPGWHRDLGLDDEGHRRCEILPSDRDGDGAPDVMEGYPESRCSIAEGARDTRGCQPGWFYTTVMLQQSTSDLPTILFTVGCVEAMMSPRAWLTLECDEDCEPWDVSLE